MEKTGITKATPTNYMTPALTKLLLAACRHVTPSYKHEKHTFLIMEREGRIFFSNVHLIVQVDKEWVISFLYKNFKIPITHEWWDAQTQNGTIPLYGRWEYTKFPYNPEKPNRPKKDWVWLKFTSTARLDGLCTDKPGRFKPVSLNLISATDTPVTLYKLEPQLSDALPEQEKTGAEIGLLFMQTPYAEFLTAFNKYYTNLDMRTHNTISCVSLYTSHTSEFVAGIMPTLPPAGDNAAYKLKSQLEVASTAFEQYMQAEEEKVNRRMSL